MMKTCSHAGRLATAVVVVIIFFFTQSCLSDTSGECINGGTYCDKFECPRVNEECFYRICTAHFSGIKCKTGIIDIKDFFWGRVSLGICPRAGITNSNCTPDATLRRIQMDNVKRLCQNETECQLKAAFDYKDKCGDEVWGDPCAKVPKYITVNYTCIEQDGLNYWSPWNEWSSCSTTCGLGSRNRNRTCTDPPQKKCTNEICATKERFPVSLYSETGECNKNVMCLVSSTSSSFVAATTSIDTLPSSWLATTVFPSSSIGEFSSIAAVSSSLPAVSPSVNSLNIMETSTVKSGMSSQMSSPPIATSSLSIRESISIPPTTPIVSTSHMTSSISGLNASLSSSMKGEMSTSSAMDTTVYHLNTFTVSPSVNMENSSVSKTAFSSLPHITIQKPQSTTNMVSSTSTHTASLLASSLPHVTIKKPASKTNMLSSPSTSTTISFVSSLPHVTIRKPQSTATVVYSPFTATSSSLASSIPHVTIQKPASKTNMVSSPSTNTVSPFISSIPHVTIQKPASKTNMLPSPSTAISGPLASSLPHVTIQKPKSATTTEASQLPSSITPSVSLPPQSSSAIVVPPVLKPEESEFYVNLTMSMTWEEFCKIEKEFREGVAKLLTDETKEAHTADQVFLMNMENCQNKPNEQAIVKFYVSAVKGKNTPDQALTKLAEKLLQGLVENGNTAELGQQFGGKVSTVNYVEPAKKDDDDDEFAGWLIALIIVAVLIFMLWCCCCLWMFCIKKRERKREPKRKYTFAQFHMEDVPKAYVDDNESYDVNLNTFRSKPPDKGVANPSYELDNIPSNAVNITIRPLSPDHSSKESSDDDGDAPDGGNSIPDNDNEGPYQTMKPFEESPYQATSPSPAAAAAPVTNPDYGNTPDIGDYDMASPPITLVLNPDPESDKPNENNSDRSSSSSDSNTSSDDEEDDKNMKPPPSPGVTRVFIGGRLVQEIAADDVGTTPIQLKLSTL